MITPRAGVTFTHKRMLEPAAPVKDRKPAVCRVTAVRNDTVYFTYDSEKSNHGAFRMSYDDWLHTYGFEAGENPHGECENGHAFFRGGCPCCAADQATMYM